MITRDDGRLALSGRLTIETVPELYRTGTQMLERDDLLVDLAGVESVDSSAVSMLLGWSRVAQSRGRTLRVASLPEGLVSLADLYGVLEMLPQSSA